MSARLAVLVLCTLALAGCAADAPDADTQGTDAAGGHNHGPEHGGNATHDFVFQANGCTEGGGHSVHPKLPNYLPDPWEMGDVMDDTGKPPLTTEFWSHPDQALPEDGNTMGNWHVTMQCVSASLDGRGLADHVFGYVGMRVEPPVFDTGEPVDRHYLITVIATNDKDFREMLHHRGFHATDATGHVGMDGGPAGELGTGLYFHNILQTADHGTYEAYFRPEAAGEMPSSFRLWFQKDNGDGTFSPIALDVHNEGGSRLRAAGFYGTFTHLETEDHAPLPGAGGESPAVAYTGFDRVITPGPTPDIRLAEAYVHL
jgi:hypothetical protein